MDTSRQLRIAGLCAALLLGACATEAAEDDAVPEPLAAAGLADKSNAEGAVLEGPGPWIVTATDGSSVTLVATAPPLSVGPASLAISTERSSGEVTPRSVDLLSPTMPMHGIVRYPVVTGVTEIDIPMAGRWTIYVNLDDAGSTHAAFVFDVAAGQGDHTHHGGR